MPSARDFRLLNAASLAYLVTKTTRPTNTTDPVYRACEWISPPKGFTDDSGVNAVLVGRTVDGVVVSWRGTLPPNNTTAPLKARIADWIHDFEGLLVPSTSFPGLVHDGFRRAVASLWDQVLAEVLSLRLTEKLPVLICGHSKGGAMALLSAWRFWSQTASICPTAVVTFEGARAADGVFQGQMSHIPVTRYEYGVDIVPHCPPSPTFLSVIAYFLNENLSIPNLIYSSVGSMQYVTDSGVLKSPKSFVATEVLNLQRMARMTADALEFDPERLITDHEISPDSSLYKYFQANISG